MRTDVLLRPAPAAGGAVGLGLLAALAGHAVAGGGPPAGLAPFALLLVVALGLLAVGAFPWLVAVLLASRASLDVLKGGPAAAIGMEPAGLVAVAFGIVAILWLIAQRRQGAPPLAATTRAFGVFTLAALVSVIGSARPLTSLVEVSRIAAVLVMLLVLDRLLADRRWLPLLLAAVFTSMLAPVVFGLLQVVTGSGQAFIGSFGRARGTFGHPNSFAIYLTFLSLMGIGLLPHLRGRARLALGALLAGGGVCLLTTYMRGAWLGFLAGAVVVLWLQARRLLPLLAAGVVVLALLAPSVPARFADLGTERHLSGNPANSLTWRLDHWGESLALARDSLVTGTGVRMVAVMSEAGEPPHNDFVRALSETGLFGLAAYLLLLGTLFATARAALRRGREGLERGVAVGFAGVLVAFTVISFAANVISQVVLLWYFAAFAAAAIAVSRSPAHEEAHR